MNGIALARALKTDPRFQDVPVILMSAGVLPTTENVADQFVPKPFELEHIEALIGQYVGPASP